MQSVGAIYGDTDGDGVRTSEELDALYAARDEQYDADPRHMRELINTNTGPAAVDNLEDDVTRGKTAAKLVLEMSEKTMPGDIGHLANIGMGEGKSIWDRMAMIIRSRSIDLRILMEAHDRRKRGFVDVGTFRRSLCYAFGDQWIDLGMTTKEFAEVIEPYLTRRPHKPGDPEAYIMWRRFTEDMQTYAEKRKRTPDFLQRLAAVEARDKFEKLLVEKYGITEWELNLAHKSLVDRLMQYNRTLAAGFRSMDKDRSGVLGRQEIRDFFADTSGFQQMGAMANTDNVNLGGVSDRAIECLLDFVDRDGDGTIKTSELIRVLEMEDLSSLAVGGFQGPRQEIEETSIRGVPLSKVKAAQRVVRDRLMINSKSIAQAFRKIDADGSGTLSREEIFALLNKHYILQYEDYYTKQIRGHCTEDQIHALLDLAGSDEDGSIGFLEFARIMSIDDIEAYVTNQAKKKRPSTLKRRASSVKMERSLTWHQLP